MVRLRGSWVAGMTTNISPNRRLQGRSVFAAHADSPENSRHSGCVHCSVELFGWTDASSMGIVKRVNEAASRENKVHIVFTK